jgi:MFS transporter, ACS family, D-galactonate transporter
LTFARGTTTAHASRAVGAMLIAIGMHCFFKSQGGEHAFKPAYLPAITRLGVYAAVIFVAVMGIYVIATEARLAEWVVALLELALALGLVGFMFARMSGDVGPVLMNRMLFCFVRESRATRPA